MKRTSKMKTTTKMAGVSVFQAADWHRYYYLFFSFSSLLQPFLKESVLKLKKTYIAKVVQSSQ